METAALLVGGMVIAAFRHLVQRAGLYGAAALSGASGIGALGIAALAERALSTAGIETALAPAVLTVAVCSFIMLVSAIGARKLIIHQMSEYEVLVYLCLATGLGVMGAFAGAEGTGVIAWAGVWVVAVVFGALVRYPAVRVEIGIAAALAAFIVEAVLFARLLQGVPDAALAFAAGLALVPLCLKLAAALAPGLLHADRPSALSTLVQTEYRGFSVRVLCAAGLVWTGALVGASAGAVSVSAVIVLALASASAVALWQR